MPRKSRRKSRKSYRRKSNNRRKSRRKSHRKSRRKSIKSSKRGYSLYTNRKGRKKVHGCGYKDADAAKDTIILLKKRNVPLNRQVWTITGLYYRAKNHPYQTKDMRDAMRVYKIWLNNHVGKC